MSLISYISSCALMNWLWIPHVAGNTLAATRSAWQGWKDWCRPMKATTWLFSAGRSSSEVRLLPSRRKMGLVHYCILVLDVLLAPKRPTSLSLLDRDYAGRLLRLCLLPFKLLNLPGLFMRSLQGLLDGNYGGWHLRRVLTCG